jgi:excisionase family DNA binding protein
MTLRQAARRLGVHESTVRRYADRGLIAAVRLPSGVRRLRRADVETLATRVRTPALASPALASETPARTSPGKTIDVLAAEQGIAPLAAVDELAARSVWRSDEEADRFIAMTHAERDHDG